MRDPLVIVAYDPRWPRLFDEEKTAILRVIKPMILVAKPIIDIMVGVRHLSDAIWCIQPLKTLNYEYVPEYEKNMPDRRYFRKGNRQGTEHGSTHHLHMAELGSDFWNRHLLFRDYLREHPEEAQRYADLKMTLAVRFASDRESYTNAKTEYVQSIVAKARVDSS
jgi:GrpB-like predicted nucleotidyltransferase (UPF0157 family)